MTGEQLDKPISINYSTRGEDAALVLGPQLQYYLKNCDKLQKYFMYLTVLLNFIVQLFKRDWRQIPTNQ